MGARRALLIFVGAKEQNVYIPVIALGLMV
jgi:hypothetical protein